MDDRGRGVGPREDLSHHDGDLIGEQRPKLDSSFARSMARAEFGRFYWNDDLESERWRSLQASHRRVVNARRELAKAKAKSKDGK